VTDRHEQEASAVPTITTIQWSSTTRYIAAVLFLFALVGLALFVWPIAADFAAALLFAFLLHIPIRAITGRTRLSYRRAAIAVYMVVYVVMALLLILGWRYLVDTLQGVISHVSEAASALLGTLQGKPVAAAWVSQILAGIHSDTLSRLVEAASTLLLGILGVPAALYGRLATVIVNVGFSIFLSNLLVFSAYGARGALRKWVPESFDREASLLLTWLDRIWGNYLAGMGLFAVVLGAGSIVEYWLLGVPYPGVFGVLTGLISLIPFVGGFLSGFIVFIPCVLLGSTRFTELDPLVFGLIVALINDILCQVSYNFVALPIIGKLVKLPYWVVLAGVMLGAASDNILFAFLAIPVFSTLRLAYTYVLAKIVGREPFPGLQKPSGPASGFLSQFLMDQGGRAASRAETESPSSAGSSRSGSAAAIT
jgi:predicted PurR-regulated permease PerM